MRKFLGVTGLLALLVIPLAGTANAGETSDTTKVCAKVKVAADVNAGANIGLYGKVLKKDSINQNVQADVSGDVYVRICVVVDNVVLTLKNLGATEVPSTKCGDGKTGIELGALADLKTSLLAGGNVQVTVDVIVDAGLLDEKETNVVHEHLALGAGVDLVGEVLADLAVCVDADTDVDVNIGEEKK